jgi:hypothetical protein
VSDIGEAEGISKSYVSRILRLALLAPDIVEATLDGQAALCRWQPAGGPEYCRVCRDDGLPCARGEPGADGRLCPTASTP